LNHEPATWRLVDSGPCDAAYNMALDESIARFVRLGESPPTLRLYAWVAPSVSIGAFQRLSDVDTAYCAAHTIPIVRRPTGGRGILHGDELTYSFCARSEGLFSHGLLDTYRRISSALQSALEMMGLPATMKRERETGRNLARSPLCFQSTSYGEVSFNARKLAGSAQKRWKDGFLQQGSIPYTIDYAGLAAVFIQKGYGIPGNESAKHMAGLRELIPGFEHRTFMDRLIVSFEKTFGVTLEDAGPSPQEDRLARQLSVEKYQAPPPRQSRGSRQ